MPSKEEYLQQEVYRLGKIITVQSWTIGQLMLLPAHSNQEWAEKEARRIVEETRNRIEELPPTEW